MIHMILYSGKLRCKQIRKSMGAKALLLLGHFYLEEQSLDKYFPARNFLPADRLYWQDFRDFTHSLQKNVGILP
jgi:hypothetical protein